MRCRTHFPPDFGFVIRFIEPDARRAGVEAASYKRQARRAGVEAASYKRQARRAGVEAASYKEDLTAVRYP